MAYLDDSVVAWALLALACATYALLPDRCWAAWTRRDP